MFEVEIMHLLNDYKNSDENEKINIKKSISNLITENNNDFNKFISNTNLENDVKDFLNICSKYISINKKQNSNENLDFDIIKNKFELWLKYFKQNNNLPDLNCEKIINDIINFYALNRFDILEKLFEINDNQDFENFKNMIKNYLRKYFTLKIQNYYESDNFNNLNFLEKRKKKKLILNLFDEIGSFKFDIKKIKELI